jgi:hypothetical protein
LRPFWGQRSGFEVRFIGDIMHWRTSKPERHRQINNLMSRTGDRLSTLAKRRSGWLIPLAVFFITACLSALLLAYYFAPARPGRADEEPAPTDATRTIALSIGSLALRIPANYILMARPRRGGPMPDIALIAMLPDLQGYTLGAAPDLSSNAPDSRVVHIVLKSGNPILPEQERLERI